METLYHNNNTTARQNISFLNLNSRVLWLLLLFFLITLIHSHTKDHLISIHKCQYLTNTEGQLHLMTHPLFLIHTHAYSHSKPSPINTKVGLSQGLSGILCLPHTQANSKKTSVTYRQKTFSHGYQNLRCFIRTDSALHEAKSDSRKIAEK